MILLKIKNKKDFINSFLGSISNLNDMGILTVTADSLTCILASADATIVCKSTINVECDMPQDSITLNIPDIKRLVRVLDILPDQSIELKIESNNISYNKGGYKFKYHLLDDGIIKQPNLNMEKVNKLNFDTTFKVKEQNLSTLFKGSSFTSETHKLYIFQEEQDKIIGELGDKNRHNTDNFVCELSNETEGSMITKPLPLNFESFRLINFNGCREMVFKVNQEMGVLTCSFKKGDTSLIYIISALIN